jgi:hypothetical protein
VLQFSLEDTMFYHARMPLILGSKGNSTQTLTIHPDNSAHMIFIDGSHTFETVYHDLLEAWRILRPGGLLLGHDCLPEYEEQVTLEEGSDEKRGVRAAVIRFTSERDLSVAILNNTLYMFVIHKGTTSS